MGISQTKTTSYPLIVLNRVQLDWTSNTSRQKINLPANQKGYDTFETTRLKALGEENSDLPGLFLFRHYFESYIE